MVGDLLRRHQPAVRRRDPAAEPRGDHAALGDRQHADDALPGRHPQHRLRAVMGARTASHDAKPASATGGQKWALRPHQGRRPDLQGQPGAARRGRRPDREGPRATTTTARRSPTRSRRSRSSHKIKVPVFLACQWTDEQTGGALPDARARASPARSASGSRSPTACTPTRSTRRRSTAGTTSCELYVARATTEAPRPARRRSRRRSSRPLMGVPGVTLPRRPDPGQADYGAARAAFEALPPVRILFDNGAGGAQPGAPFRASSSRSRASRCRARRARSWYLADGGALSAGQAGHGGRRRVHLEQGRPPGDRLQRRHRLGPAACGPPLRRYDWTQNPAGTRCPT